MQKQTQIVLQATPNKMLNLSFHRIYIFLFFTGAYAFLSFWISVTYFFNIIPFLIGGIIFYLFVSLFHKAIIRITEKNQTKEINKDFKINLFFFGLITFCMFYLAGVYFMQWLVINYLDVPSNIFKIVNWSLNILSLSISFLLSFLEKKAA